nr:MAG TPA: hypothetical protein [Caudoviricetes sp.]DAY08490.1 MAG TPA: hypothetical protein [Caudoviricetes sp.]
MSNSRNSHQTKAAQCCGFSLSPRYTYQRHQLRKI